MVHSVQKSPSQEIASIYSETAASLSHKELQKDFKFIAYIVIPLVVWNFGIRHYQGILWSKKKLQGKCKKKRLQETYKWKVHHNAWFWDKETTKSTTHILYFKTKQHNVYNQYMYSTT